MTTVRVLVGDHVKIEDNRPGASMRELKLTSTNYFNLTMPCVVPSLSRPVIWVWSVQTLQALGVMGCYKEDWPLLVVAPASMRLM